jgi:hypothetical protein
MVYTLSWQNSELLRLEDAGGKALHLRFAAAFVCPVGRAASASWGYLRPLTLRFEQAELEGDVADCIGQIALGQLWLAEDNAMTTGRATIELPWATHAPLRLVLRFRQGGELSIRAASAYGAPPHDARFTESFAC